MKKLKWYFTVTKDNPILDLLVDKQDQRRQPPARVLVWRIVGGGTAFFAFILSISLMLPVFLLLPLVFFGFPIYMSITSTILTNQAMQDGLFQQVRLTPVEPIMVVKGFIDASIKRNWGIRAYPLIAIVSVVLMAGGVLLIAYPSYLYFYKIMIGGVYFMISLLTAQRFAVGLGVWCGLRVSDTTGAAALAGGGMFFLTLLNLSIGLGLIPVMNILVLEPTVLLIIIGMWGFLLWIPIWLTMALLDDAARRIDFWTLA